MNVRDTCSTDSLDGVAGDNGPVPERSLGWFREQMEVTSSPALTSHYCVVENTTAFINEQMVFSVSSSQRVKVKQSAFEVKASGVGDVTYGAESEIPPKIKNKLSAGEAPAQYSGHIFRWSFVSSFLLKDIIYMHDAEWQPSGRHLRQRQLMTL